MSIATSTVDATFGDGESIKKRVMRKLYAKIIGFFFICWVINYLDRVNVGFAALQMNAELGFTPSIFGFGAGIFAVSYMIFEVPSNILLHKVGARVWFMRIMVTWGLISCGMAFIQGPQSFYWMRFLLGAAEAGFAPGVILYMTLWFPARERSRAIGLFMTATVVATIIGAPLSGWIIDSTHTWLGYSGWRWLFLLEGAPAVILGVIAYFYLVDDLESDTRWLTADERSWLTKTLAAERQVVAEHGLQGMMEALTNWRVWILVMFMLPNAIAIYGLVIWLPQIVKQVGGLTNIATGFVTAIPFIFAAIGLWVVAYSSDRTGERKFHVAGAAFIGGIFLGLSALANSPFLSLALLCVAAFGMWGLIGTFWSIPTQFLTGGAAATGIAVINGFPQISGFIGPYLVGVISQSTGNFQYALLALAVGPILSGFICLSLKVRRE